MNGKEFDGSPWEEKNQMFDLIFKFAEGMNR
jgi:hypothetical protein